MNSERAGDRPSFWATAAMESTICCLFGMSEVLARVERLAKTKRRERISRLLGYTLPYLLVY